MNSSTRRHLLRVGLAMLGLLLGLQGPAYAAGTEGKVSGKPTRTSRLYDYYLTGSSRDATPDMPASQMLVLMGGGLDVDAAFKAMVEKAALRDKVDVVIIRATGADGYNQYLYDLYADGPDKPIDSVETLVIKSREAADNAEVNAIVAKADVIFIAGGDQWDYVNLWKGSLLDASLQALQQRRVPIGGTSAGLAVLGAFDFSAQNGTITSAQALGNPYDRRLTLDRDFITRLPGLANTIADAHLVTRDRMGRLMAFLARLIADRWVSEATLARGIGADENAALVVDDQVGTVLGSGAVYFLNPSLASGQQAVVQAKKPLTLPAVGVYRLRQQQGGFDLANWLPTGAGAGQHYQLDVYGGQLSGSGEGLNGAY